MNAEYQRLEAEASEVGKVSAEDVSLSGNTPQNWFIDKRSARLRSGGLRGR